MFYKTAMGGSYINKIFGLYSFWTAQESQHHSRLEPEKAPLYELKLRFMTDIPFTFSFPRRHRWLSTKRNDFYQFQ